MARSIYMVEQPFPPTTPNALRAYYKQCSTYLLSKSNFLSYSELRCTFGGRFIIPDITVFTWNRILRDENGEVANTFALAPDWTIEILSPEQNQTKVVRNILHCLTHGYQIGWLIDPAEKLVFVYFPDQRMVLLELESDRLSIF